MRNPLISLGFVALILALSSACTDGEDGPAVCADPTGVYSATVHWTTGDCQVADSAIEFSIRPTANGTLMVGVVGWGAGTASVLETGNSCAIQVAVEGPSAGGTAHYHWTLSPDGEALQGSGSAQVTTPTGSCSRAFELVNLRF